MNKIGECPECGGPITYNAGEIKRRCAVFCPLITGSRAWKTRTSIGDGIMFFAGVTLVLGVLFIFWG